MIDTAIEKLKEQIKKAHDNTSQKLASNIYRGHLRSISADIEDAIALFIKDIIPAEYKLYLDSSVHIDKKKKRPDLLIVNEKNEVKAMVEIKSNMGYCRNATEAINKMKANHDKFLNKKVLICEFSREVSQAVIYDSSVKLFLISLTKENCTATNHAMNKAYAKQNGVFMFNLFSGWYWELQDCEIRDFAAELTF